MSTRRTDAASAVVVAFVVWTIGRIRGYDPTELLRPGPFLAGVAGALLLESGFARWPARARRLWRRPVVRLCAPIVVIGTVLAADRSASHRETDTAGATPFAVVFGGLSGYFLLLAGIVSGVVPDPATWFDPLDRGSDRE